MKSLRTAIQTFFLNFLKLYMLDNAHHFCIPYYDFWIFFICSIRYFKYRIENRVKMKKIIKI